MTEFQWNQENLDTFWRFIHERHSIWDRRFVKNESWPWTSDPILQKNKFTNIYRELDPGTIYAKVKILETRTTRPERVFNIMIYRLICSISTFDALGLQDPFDFDYERFYNVLDIIYNSGMPVFGNAYLISPYSSMGFDRKHENVARLFRNVAQDFPEFFSSLDHASSLEFAFKTVNSMYGFGPFLAYQVCVDLMYPLMVDHGRPIIPFKHDDWARLGPGALRGLGRLTKTWSTAMTLEALRWLHQHQAFEFERLNLEFPWWRDANGVAHPISLSNMQNCLCEFHKYMSIRDGSGKAQRLYFHPFSGRP